VESGAASTSLSAHRPILEEHRGSSFLGRANGIIPWLTVIMPSYCGEQWIDAALNSLAVEATEGVEVLVIDSSPSSLTRDIANRYSDRLNLRVLERCDLPTWQTKTNFGVQIARSSHVCWLGVDDLWFPGRAAAVQAWIRCDPDAALHLAPCAIIDKRGRRLGVWRCPLTANRELQSSYVTERLLVQNFVAAPAPVFRRDAWLACGGLDIDLWYTADWDIWLKLVARRSLYYHDQVTAGFRIHDGSLTVTGSRNTADFADQMRIVLDRHLVKFGGNSRQLERTARASIVVNVALAAALGGELRGLWHAASSVARLGPVGAWRYLHDSRIMDRVAPRVRAKLTAAF
jgi:glycosyltransferase involved in cell wall biosynthesis